ncbi:hypothetical protein RRG08_013533 [Elysia crispata]|uniref:Uncharacterized protein n=1 Tax=Elysia crispata TaxID=231223 RepID=A0AAE1CR36_9GAST|nr:hypothetical protein RRG08_013533 [Elysia crispata]
MQFLGSARPCSFLAQSVELSPIFYLRIERGEDRNARSVWDFLLSERQSWVPPYNIPTGSVSPSRLERAEARMRGVSGIFYCPRDRVGSRLTIHRQTLCLPRAWKGLRLGCEECLGFSTVRETELGPALTPTGSVSPSRLERAEARMRGVSGIFYCPRDRVGSRLTIHRQALCLPRAWKGLRLGCEECLGFSTVRETELGPALQYTDRLCVSLAPGKG